MRRQAIGLVLALVGACSSGHSPGSQVSAEQPATSETSSVAVEAIFDAGPRPDKEQAMVVLERFAERLLARDLEGARAEMRIPDSFNDKQVAFFLRELGNGEHLCADGLASVLAKDFGRIEERLGDKAANVAAGAHLPIEEAFVLGDLDGAVIMQWDGKRFWISALHRLGPEG